MVRCTHSLAAAFIAFDDDFVSRSWLRSLACSKTRAPRRSPKPCSPPLIWLGACSVFSRIERNACQQRFPDVQRAASPAAAQQRSPWAVSGQSAAVPCLPSVIAVLKSLACFAIARSRRALCITRMAAIRWKSTRPSPTRNSPTRSSSSLIKARYQLHTHSSHSELCTGVDAFYSGAIAADLLTSVRTVRALTLPFRSSARSA